MVVTYAKHVYTNGYTQPHSLPLSAAALRQHGLQHQSAPDTTTRQNHGMLVRHLGPCGGPPSELKPQDQ